MGVKDGNVCALLLLCILATSSIVGSHAGIVRRSGTQFIDEDCKAFTFSSWNSWQLLESALGMGPSLDSIFSTMQASGLTVGRFFGHGSSDKVVLQNGPGSYSNQALFALDKILDEASKRNIRLVIAFTDNWQKIDGKAGFAGWAGKQPGEFFTDPTAKQFFKDHIRFITNRVNSVNGKEYKKDPAILAWNLMNEPRCDCDVWKPVADQCEPGCADRIQAWVEEMSAFAKSQDPYHMITVGEEGFYSFNSGREHVNPDAGPWSNPEGLARFMQETGFTAEEALWAKRSGQDFVRNHRPEAIDYAAIHLWVDNWGVPNLSFQQHWIREHINDARSLGKPLVVEEFGKVAPDNSEGRRAERNPFFQDMYSTFFQQRASGGPLKGIGFWQYSTNRRTEISVNPADSTWKEIIVPKSKEVVAELQSRGPLGSCIPGEVRSFDAAQSSAGKQYMTAGVRLLAANPGSALLEESSSTLTQCLDLCDDVVECNAVSYMSQQNECVLYSEANDVNSYIWSSDGSQTYWRLDGVVGSATVTNSIVG